MRIILLTVALAVLVFESAYCQTGCRAVSCLAIEYPPTCRVTYFTVKGDQVCRLCDDCIKSTNFKDENGCPVRACNMRYIEPACMERRYYIFNNRICEDCPRDVCELS